MKVEELNSWEQLEEALKDLEHDLKEVREVFGESVSELIFRGHENKEWRLKTTLERFFSQEVSLAEYFKIARTIAPHIESLTNTDWKLPELPDYEEYLQSTERYIAGEYPALPYIAYLRHHGFPSPLLDWTASPYVAAFFAFRNPPQEKVNRIAIYSYVDCVGGAKAGARAGPYIQTLEKYVRTHKRHFSQQSRYTICTVFKDGELERERYYANHEDVVAVDHPAQDLLWKFTLPVDERKKVLTSLRRMNITAYSLFGSEESLLETIATNDLFLEGLT